MDIMLPEIDGKLSLTRWLRDHSNVPIIMVTARREEIDRIAGSKWARTITWSKPFSPQELVNGVRAVLRRVGRDQVEADLSGHYPFHANHSSTHAIVTD